jgi:hypothetical protein
MIKFVNHSICKSCDFIKENFVSEIECEKLAIQNNAHYESGIIFEDDGAVTSGAWVNGEMSFSTAEKLCKYEGWI